MFFCFVLFCFLTTSSGFITVLTTKTYNIETKINPKGQVQMGLASHTRHRPVAKVQ